MLINIGYDLFLKKEVKKIRYETPPSFKIFNPSDVFAGNSFSNIAIAFVYTWKKDKPPKKVREAFQKIANYSAITGYWRTTNGARYVFTNLLANPNINKLIVLVFGAKDNGHLLVDALINFWTNGIDKEGRIIGAKAANPKFEGVPQEALKRLKKQADLVVCKGITDPKIAEKIAKSAIQEPKNAADTKGLGVEFYSETIKNKMLYDDGCRFEKPLNIDLSLGMEKIEECKEQTSFKTIGGSLSSKNLKEAFKDLVSFISKYGAIVSDQRGIKTKECRSLTITISDPLKESPEGFSKYYLEKYTKEFIEGLSSKDFSYTYYNRIFKRWGNQADKVTEILKRNNNTRRALISLWDPSCDVTDENPPCLNFIWAAVRNGKLEFHAMYRSHHVATMTEDGKIVTGEGAFVPNIYALAVLQEQTAKKLGLERGSLTVTDLSSHIYVSR